MFCSLQTKPLLLTLATLITAQTVPAYGQVRVFFGNLHSHTKYSDGSGTPAEAYRHARHVAKLDFLAITEHNHAAAEDGAEDRADGLLIATNHALYDELKTVASEETENGRFIALFGQEFSSISKGNHAGVLEVPAVIDVPNGKFDKLVRDWLPSNLDSTGKLAVLQFNHPALFDNDQSEYGADDFGGPSQWIKEMGKVTSLIEVLNGPAMTRTGGHRAAEVMEEDYLHYLNLGFHLSPTGDQDNHYFTWGTATDARTGVVLDELTRPKLLDALRNRRTYATEDKNLRVIFKINDRMLGDRVPAPAANTPLVFTLSVHDDDEPGASYDVDLFGDTIGGADVAEVLKSDSFDGNKDEFQVFTLPYPTEPGTHYFFIRLKQHPPDGVAGHADRVWTAPIWFEPTGDNPVPLTESFLASRRSGVYHVSDRCLDAQRIRAENRITGAAAKEGRQRHAGCPRTN